MPIQSPRHSVHWTVISENHVITWLHRPKGYTGEKNYQQEGKKYQQPSLLPIIGIASIIHYGLGRETYVYTDVGGHIRPTLTLILLIWRIGWAPNSIPIYVYIQRVATLHSLFISGNCSTCFGWYFDPSSGTHTTVSTASGICHTVTAICRYRGRDGTGVSVLWVAYATHSTLKPVATLPR
jgi:hypothetical protein